MPRVLFSLLIVSVLFSMPGCQRFRKLSHEVARLEKSYYLRGQLASEPRSDAKVWAFVLEKNAMGLIRFVDVEQIGPGGAFLFMLPPSEYYHVGVAEDLNGNERYDDHERLWLYGDPSPVPFNHGSSEILAADLDHPVTVSESDRRALWELRAGRRLLALKSGTAIPIVGGDVADLNDAQFSLEMGEAGLWTPETFLHESGYGVYCLDRYDPDRVPVLFVNGAGGSPRQFQSLFKALDQRDYQCWFFHYPTGMPLARSAKVLNILIEDLQASHQFPTLHVIAHSMGGLVSRAFILQNRQKPENRYVKRYITISTPWNGHEAAAMGVKRAPAVIPSWVDMQTGSDFINDLLGQPLHDDVNHYLLFSFKGKNAMFLPASNDGVVSLTSQLDSRAQQQAVFRRGFDVGHVAILEDAHVAETVLAILDGGELGI